MPDGRVVVHERGSCLPLHINLDLNKVLRDSVEVSLQELVAEWATAQAYPMALTMCPEVLCIQVNRFNDDATCKSSRYVVPESTLAIRSFNDDVGIDTGVKHYGLTAAIVHYGDTPSSGHYRCLLQMNDHEQSKFLTDDNQKATSVSPAA